MESGALKMAFERKPFLFEEDHLYDDLPFVDRSMGFGHIGHVRAELIWYDFHHMWCPDRKDLATPAFRRELKALVGTLRKGPFISEPALDSFGSTMRPLEVVGDYDIFFKVQSEGYSYFVRCHPMERGHDITIRAYDNALLLPELAGKHELPEACYTALPESGELALLVRNRRRITAYDSDEIQDVRREADMLNEIIGVTRAQEAAMYMGCKHGFDQPCAWPWQYEGLGGHGKQHKEMEAI